MKVKDLIARLQNYDPETEVTMTINGIRDLKVKNVDVFFGNGESSIKRIDLVLTQ